jgi:hypothetical protein
VRNSTDSRRRINNYMACRAIFDVKQGAPTSSLGGQALPDSVDRARRIPALRHA